jgi:hypothetical protein
MGLICSIFGHNWRNNLVPYPSKRICKRCKRKEAYIMPLKGWCGFVKVDSFPLDKRSDKELIKKWVKYK